MTFSFSAQSSAEDFVLSLLRAQALFGKPRSHKQTGTVGGKKLCEENTQDPLRIFLSASSQLCMLTDMLVASMCWDPLPEGGGHATP